ncbi:hypothetical protein BOTBODRAFT_28365 [Botryobasidium botryosum FD-172 SS1]|uniref:Uncharacterized protein n=1 Tax=Botryobasidium botryosum (strain FD-172 SS1) TaxID=930990 RepID=A0A067N556_BOTB1|nr:hypothetical protein BOTBODRAFT_28365 [Botryobasidium botryosum FD-172 SS1]
MSEKCRSASAFACEVLSSPTSLAVALLLGAFIYLTLSDSGRNTLHFALSIMTNSHWQSPVSNPKGSTPGSFSLSRAYTSFIQYEHYAKAELDARRRLYKTLDRQGKRLGQQVGYLSKLDALARAVERNAVVTRAIAALAFEEQVRLGMVRGGMGRARAFGAESYADPGRVKEALKHFIRDWSAEGREERERLFSPILDVLKADTRTRKDLKVLVPGAGLGRLAWEIANLGFDSTANEYSCFMTLACRFLLSPKATTSAFQHTIHPFCHNFSHQKNLENTARQMRFPDVVPRAMSNLHLVEGDFLALSPVPTYDYVVTLFFIDTALSITDYLTQIYELLNPGGTWINLGPLLWTSGSVVKMELDLEEVLHLAKLVGFEILTQPAVNAPRTVESEYTGDAEGMMRWIYQAEFWVARKMNS